MSINDANGNVHSNTDGRFTEKFGTRPTGSLLTAPEPAEPGQEPSEVFGFDWNANEMFQAAAPALAGRVRTAEDAHGVAALRVVTDEETYLITGSENLAFVVQDQISAGGVSRVPAWLVERETGVDAEAIQVLQEQLGARSWHAIAAIMRAADAEYSLADAIASDSQLRTDWFGAGLKTIGKVLVWPETSPDPA